MAGLSTDCLGNSDPCTAHRRKCERIRSLVDAARVKDVEETL